MFLEIICSKLLTEQMRKLRLEMLNGLAKVTQQLMKSHVVVCVL